MKKLIFLFGLFSSLLIQAQPLTGTWLSYYYRDNPGDKRLFFYRLYLKQSNDSLYGICESLDIQADVLGLHPENASVTARQIVYNHSFSRTDSIDFQLFAGTFEAATGGFIAAKKSPIFQTLNCQTVPKQMPLHPRLPIIYSTVPVSDGPIGELYMQKVSDSIPDLFAYMNSSSESFKRASKIGLPKLFEGKAKKEVEPEAKKSTIALPIEKRTNELQASFKTSSEIARIELYDNGEVDNDTVSLYFNGNLLADRQRLSNLPLHFNVKLELGKENNLLLFAHNLGSIPPNTAFMLVTVGTKEYRVNLSSSLEKNALIVFKRE